MAELPLGTWLTIGGIAAVLVIGTLHALARAIENETRKRETRAKAARLKADYESAHAQAQDVGFEEVIGVDVIEEQPARAAA